jgi:predicted transcriptional regulator
MQEKKYRYMSFLISPELEDVLKSASIAKDRSASWIIKKALCKYLKFKEPVVNPKPRGKTSSR